MRWFPDSMPVPSVGVHTAPWWDAAAEHRLVVQACRSCGATRHPPAPVCWRCQSDADEWNELPGTGSVFTFSRVHQAFVPALAEQVPYVVAAIDLDEGGGARLVSNVVDCDPHDVHIGMPVRVVWEDMGPTLALPRFVPA